MKVASLRLLVFLLVLCMTAASPVAFGVPAPSAAPPAAPGDVKNFSLLDYQGKHYELRRADAAVVVLFFTGAECPIARQAAPKVKAIEEEFRKRGVVVWMINATPQNDPDENRLDMMFRFGQFAPKRILGDRYALSQMRDLVPQSILGDRATIRSETLQYAFGVPPLPPVLRDEHQLVSRHFGVSRTCEAIAIDTKKSSIIYRGAVDDQLTEGARKPQASQQFLRDALNEFLAGKPVTTPSSKVHGCAISYATEVVGAAADKPDEPVPYVRQVAPLLLAKCADCHSEGGVGPFAMSSYDKVKGWSAMIEEVVLDRRMPPWHADPHVGKFANSRSLSGPEARTLLRWVEQGCPRGEGDDPLAARQPASADWPLGKPDFVVALPPQDVPATGTVDYRYVDSDFVAPRDLWLRAATTRPGSPRVVHHIIVRLRVPEAPETERPDSFLLTSWVPGLGTGECPPGTGLFVPKGAKFNFEVHYTPDGEERTDRSEVGLYLVKETPRMRIDVRAAHTRALDIPPGEADAKHAATYFFERDAIVYGLSPHMHLRGKWFRFELLTPDGKRRTLLSVPNYDFNWQTSYRLAEPLRVPRGSWMLCTGGFDNSSTNPHNPDPSVRVNWGPQTYNEMFMGFITLAEPPADNAANVASGAEPAERPSSPAPKD
jgi:hypothetical protein